MHIFTTIAAQVTYHHTGVPKPLLLPGNDAG